ncbi:TniQ family protein [Xanthobacter sp. V0B-10]|uniref:TniQ family protein n=1 Tax=Xanthobacter albus TaxID=3119929 RepID=UPI00372C9984
MSIPWTLEPGDKEMPSDFASRLSARVCRDDLSGFCRDFDLDCRGLVDGVRPAVDGLAALAGVDAEGIAREAFTRLDGQKRFLHKGHQVIQQNLPRDRVRACPACLQEDLAKYAFREAARPHRRSTWLIEYVRTCPRHGMALMALGSASLKARRHDTSLVLAAAIPGIDALARAAVRRPVSAFETYLLELLEGTARPVPWVDALPFHAVMRLSAMVGGAEVLGPRVAIDSLEDHARWETEAVGFDILLGGEQRILAFLDRLQSSFTEGRVRCGPHPLFGHLYEWLAHQTDDPAYNPIRDLMWLHARQTLPIGPGDRMFGCEIQGRDLHSVRSASQEHALHPKTTRRILMDAGLIAAASDALPDDRVVFDAAAADRLLSDVAESVSLAAAARYLGMTKPHLMLFVDAGLVSPWIAGARGERNHGFLRADLDGFRGRLFGAWPVMPEAPAGYVALPVAAKRACCSLTEIAKLVIEGRLDRIARVEGFEGLACLVVDPAEVRPLVVGRRHGTLTLREAERELGMSTSAVKRLIEEGFLATVLVENPVRRQAQRVIEPEALLEFQRQYVSLHALAKERRKAIRSLGRELATVGVVPVRDPAALHLTLYDRADIP